MNTASFNKDIDDIKEEKAKQLMCLLTQNIQSCIDQLDS